MDTWLILWLVAMWLIMGLIARCMLKHYYIERFVATSVLTEKEVWDCVQQLCRRTLMIVRFGGFVSIVGVVAFVLERHLDKADTTTRKFGLRW